MSRRVLVLSASVGAGHLRAAQAVELALRELDPQATVENDVLEQIMLCSAGCKPCLP